MRWVLLAKLQKETKHIKRLTCSFNQAHFQICSREEHMTHLQKNRLWCQSVPKPTHDLCNNNRCAAIDQSVGSNPREENKRSSSHMLQQNSTQQQTNNPPTKMLQFWGGKKRETTTQKKKKQKQKLQSFSYINQSKKEAIKTTKTRRRNQELQNT